jgi:hypothetical protein
MIGPRFSLDWPVVGSRPQGRQPSVAKSGRMPPPGTCTARFAEAPKIASVRFGIFGGVPLRP